MKRTVLALVAAVALAVPVAAQAAAPPPVVHFAQQTTLGFYRGKIVEYLDFGPVQLAKGNAVAPIWSFTNGAPGQRNIIDTVPGKKDYSPLWDVTLLTWKEGMTPQVLMSAAAVKSMIAKGELTTKHPGIVVNCPVV